MTVEEKQAFGKFLKRASKQFFIEKYFQILAARKVQKQDYALSEVDVQSVLAQTQTFLTENY